MTHKTYRPWAPDQDFLLPPRPREWLPEDHLVYFLLDVVHELDLSAITRAIQAKDPRGVIPFDPAMMTALLVYGYTRGVYSSRKLARATYEDVPIRFLVGGNHPHFTTIATFRRQHLKALAQLFVQVLRLCEAAGLVKLGHVSLDGTKLQANASKHSAMSYDRMKQDEARLVREVEELLKQAAQQDAEDDERLGADQDEQDVPAELARRERRLERIRAARAALEQEAAQARARELRELAASNEERVADPTLDEKQRKAAGTRALSQRKKADELDPPDDQPPSASGAAATPTTSAASLPSDTSDVPQPPSAPPSPPAPNDLPRHEPAHDSDGDPAPSAQRNFTDPDSRIMFKGSDVLQAYNAQAAVDAESHVIVGHLLSNEPPDVRYLQPVVAEVQGNLGRLPDKLSADAGFWSEANARWCEQMGIDAYIATRRDRHHPAPVPPRSADPPLPQEAGADPPPACQPPDAIPPPPDGERSPIQKEKMRTKLDTKEGQDVYRLRKCTPEPVFGNIKEARGFRRFYLRGLEKVQREWALVCTAHNLLKLFAARQATA